MAARKRFASSLKMVAAAAVTMALLPTGYAAAQQAGTAAPQPPGAPESWHQTGSESESFMITATRSTGVGARDVITCEADKQVPHKSTHNPASVNVVAVVKCTKPVDRISANIALYRNGALIRQSGYQNSFGKARAKVNTSGACLNATYGSWRGFTIDFPTGYLPQSQTWPPEGQNDLGYGPANQVTTC